MADSTIDAPLARVGVTQERAAPLGWPWLALSSSSSNSLRPGPFMGMAVARRVINMFGLVLGASAGLLLGGLGALLLAALLHPFWPDLAELLLLSVTLSSIAAGAVMGRRVLQRETYE